MQDGLAALVTGWPLGGVRLVAPDGSTLAEVGDVRDGAGRQVPLAVSGTAVGTAEVFGEVDPVDDEMLQLIGLRLAAGDCPRTETETIMPNPPPTRHVRSGMDRTPAEPTSPLAAAAPLPTRRRVLAIAAVTGAGGVLTACGGGDDDTATTGSGGQSSDAGGSSPSESGSASADGGRRVRPGRDRGRPGRRRGDPRAGRRSS